MENEEITFSAFNPIEALPISSIPDYLLSSLQEDNIMIFIDSLQDVIDYYGARLISEKTGLSRENLYKILRGDRTPSLQTVHKIIWAFKSGAISDHRATLSK